MHRLAAAIPFFALLVACSGGDPAGTGADVSAGVEAAAAVDVVDAVDGPVPLEDGALIPWIIAEAGEDALYRSAQTDLDGDGYEDALVYIGGPTRCGSGGCNLYMLRITPAGIEQVGRTTVTKLPVGVLESSTNGYRDVVVTIGGGGLQYYGLRVLRFDGERYPSNPTVAPAEKVDDIGEELISDGPLRPLVWPTGPVNPVEE